MPHLCTLLQCALPVLVLTWNGLSAQVHHLRLQVQEGLPASTVVGDLRAALPSGSGVSGFFISESRDSEVFRDLEIDSDSGIISTAASLDRERRDRYEFAAATLTGEVIRVTVVVKDVNDHWPTFPAEAVELNVSESSLPGSRFELPGALDLDEGQFGTQGYRLLTGRAEELFKVELRTGGGSTILNFDLVLMEKLDREGQDLYSLTVEAFDGGVPPKTGHLQVHVNVLDENDNPPVFNQSEYQAVLWENAPLLTPVCQVFAVDPDLGNNGLVTYEINRRQSDPNEFFIVDKNTGVILLNKPLDYETQTFFELVVTAKDHGVQPESSNTFVGIKVLDVNDNSPNINLLFLSESGDPEVSEGAAYGEYVARIAISDPDLGEIKKVSVFLEGGDQKFTLKATDEFLYALCVDGPLDREQKDLYELTVVASDFGSPPLRSERTFLLQVTDVNDNPPSFEQKVYEVSVPEDLPAGGSVLQVKALDRDQDSGIFYSILRSTQDHLLNIHPQSGIISTAAGLDREREADLAFLVVAVDGGFPPLTSTATVNIHVEDINDNKPVFTQQLYNTTIQEHLPNATCFLQVSAEDADGGEYGMVHYSFSDGYNGEDSHPLFHINPVTGDICVSQDIDRDEGLLTFDLLVKAEDQVMFFNEKHVYFSPPVDSVEALSYRISSGDPLCLFSVDPRSGVISTSLTLDHESTAYTLLTLQALTGSLPVYSTTQVNITITDTNDNPPVFPKTSDYITISHNTPPGTILFLAHAHDADSGENGRIHYSLRPQSEVFSIHPQLGMLTLNGYISRDANRRYRLSVVAEDEGSPSLSSSLNLVVELDSSNPAEETLAFETLIYQVEIGEGAQRDTRVIQVRAHASKTRRGSDLTPVLKYSLEPLSKPPPFLLHPDTGWLFVAQSLDYESEPSYRFTVRAEAQSAAANLTATATVVVTVQDENDNAPVFSRDRFFFRVPEGPSPHGLIGAVKATDRDSRKNGQLSYILLSDGKHFRINSKTGEIINWVALDREEHSHHTLRVLVTDNGHPRLNASTTVHILVSDINDNPPEFTHLPANKQLNVQVLPVLLLPYLLTETMFAKDRDAGENATVHASPKQNDVLGLRQFTVKENTQLGTVIGSFQVSGSSSTQVRYSVAEGDGSLHFGIDSCSGALYVAQPLDYEATQRYFLIVRAEALPAVNATVPVSVSVEDVNDHSPWFPGKDSIVVIGVEEDVAVGTVVYTFNARDGDGSVRNSAIHYSMTFDPDSSVEEEPPFRIDPDSGSVSTTAELNRERLQSFSFTVTAGDRAENTDAQRFTSITAQVFLLDVNDNTPVFVSTETLQVAENVQVGSLIFHLLATDEDEGENSHVTYSLIGGNKGGHFRLERTGTDKASTSQTSQVLNRQVCYLYLNSSLNYESQHAFSLTVQASDCGLPSLSSTQTLSVEVLDVNDEVPVFQRRVYLANVSENREPGEPVVRVTAVDLDSGNHTCTQVKTCTPPGCTQPTLNPVAINPVVLNPFALNPLDPTQPCRTQPHHTRPAKLNPFFFSKNVNCLCVFITEENGMVSYSLLPGSGYEFFTIDSHTGLISTSTQLDREIHQSFTLRGEFYRDSTALRLGLKTTTHILQCLKPYFYITIPENLHPGAIHTTQSLINSLDPDGRFSVDPVSGVVSTLKALDREERCNYTLILTASDQGPSPLTSTTLLSISLSDQNDNSPAFSRKSYRASVSEGLPVGSQILQLIASDPDEGPNGDVTFSLAEDTFGTFSVDPETGVVLLTKPLDRETRSQLVLEAKDSGSPPLTGSCTVRVQVVDVNDNSPAIPAVEPLVVAENLPAGHMVTQIMANDVDLNSAIIYSLAGHGEEDGSFAIDRYSGVITTTRTLDYEEQVLHTLRIRASDSIHQTEAELTVQVLDVNDNAPIFSLEFYQVSLSELTSADSFVVAVSATDRDSGLNGKISYRLLSSLMKGFYVDAENEHFGLFNTLKLLHDSLCYVTSDHHVIRLLVEARDSGDPSLSSITSVDVLVEDCNDHAPFFQNNSYQVSVGEDTPAGSLLLTLQAEDQDYSDQNTHLDYTITAGNEQRRFCVEVVSVPSETLQRTVGYLILCAGLDREITEVYSLTVTVTDRGVPPLNSSATVSVFVLDVNDHEPVFNSSEYHAQASENSLFGTILVQVSAQDLDLGANGTVQYNIISGNSKGLFRLDPQTGSLEVSDTLDYEEDTKHILTVQASDGGVPGDRKVSFAVIFITVLDENDNSPFFMFSTINCSVAENLPAFTPVCMVHAVDQDAGTFGLLTYSILSSCFMDYGSGNPDRKEAFAIDPLTGDIHTRQTFDYERDSEYCFLVEARDKGDQTATVKVQVDIEGMDEFSPVFTQKVYQFALPDNARIGESVGHVMAMDHDGGLDGIVQYSLVNPSPFFNINKTTGSVYISNPVYRRKGSALNEEVEDLSILASSPKLDSRSTACHVIVNISNSAEALTGTSLSVQTVSLSVSLTVFLLLLISFVALVLRYKTKENALKKAASLAVNLNHGTGTFGRLGSYPQNGISAINLQDLHAPLDMRAKRDISNPLRSSGSSGRGSAEGETAEDQEIKMINEYQRMKQPAAVMLEPDTGIPIDSDQLSCHSVDAHVVAGANLGAGHMVEMASAESLHTFKEEGGGEGMLPRVVNMREMEEIMRCCMPLPDHQDSIEGSLTNLICPEEQLRGSYGWDHLLNWEPRFQPLASVFTDIGMLPDEEAGDKPAGPAEFHSLLRPPPLITGVAQPGIRAVPPRMPQRIVSLGRKPSYPKYAYSPLARNTGLTPSVMTPSFSPSLSLLTLRTPNASPVVSETGVGSFPKVAPLPGDISVEAEIRV
uniref:Protocadherin-16 n=1 Tax=Astyanax mexicanus TaxID=7994 RepID=A0A8B9HFJ7_ASTMX